MTTQVDTDQAFVDYSQGVFGQCIGHRIQLNWAEIFPATHWNSEELERPFNEEEVRESGFPMGGDKSPRPDGFSACFSQAFWGVLKKDVIELFEEFHRGSLEIDRLNYAYVVLIPKREVVDKVHEFRPITLLNAIYKIITKVLTTGLNTNYRFYKRQVHFRWSSSSSRDHF